MLLSLKNGVYVLSTSVVNDDTNIVSRTSGRMDNKAIIVGHAKPYHCQESV